MAMNSKERLLTAIKRGVPDRLPVTTHHLMSYFLNRHMGGASNQVFFEHFGLDAVHWTVPHKPDSSSDEYYDPDQGELGFLESRRIASDRWRVESEGVPDTQYETTRYRFITPKGELTMVLQSNEYTSWVGEHLIKEKRDVDLIAEYATAPKCDVDAVNQEAEAFGDNGLVRGHICCFVAPYDAELIGLAHEAGQRISYHTCGGMMPILENIAAMKPDAMETFTPPDMGGDTDLAKAKARIGDKVCMIGGFDQFHHLLGCSEEETRAAVRRCFEAAGENGGFILSPSDHFFDADLGLLHAFADEARRCAY